MLARQPQIGLALLTDLEVVVDPLHLVLTNLDLVLACLTDQALVPQTVRVLKHQIAPGLVQQVGLALKHLTVPDLEHLIVPAHKHLTDQVHVHPIAHVHKHLAVQVRAIQRHPTGPVQILKSLTVQGPAQEIQRLQIGQVRVLKGLGLAQGNLIDQEVLNQIDQNQGHVQVVQDLPPRTGMHLKIIVDPIAPIWKSLGGVQVAM